METFITKDLVELVESRYRAGPEQDSFVDPRIKEELALQRGTLKDPRREDPVNESLSEEEDPNEEAIEDHHIPDLGESGDPGRQGGLCGHP